MCHTSVCSLSPGKRYYYVYGDYYGWSGEKSFKAAPSSKTDVTTNIIAFGGPTNHLTLDFLNT